MAYTVADGAIVQCRISGFIFGQRVITTFSYKLLSDTPINGADGIAALETAVNTATTGLYARYRACISEDVNTLFQNYQWITPVRYAVTGIDPTQKAGSNDTTNNPNLAMVVTRRGEQAGRHFVSNLHLPGVPTAEVAAGELSPTLIELLNTFAATACQTVNVGFGQTLAPVAFNRAAPLDSAFLIEGYAQDTVRTMHRRTVGVGA